MFPAHLAVPVRKRPQLIVDEREEPIERARIAGTGSCQQLGYFVRRTCRHQEVALACDPDTSTAAQRRRSVGIILNPATRDEGSRWPNLIA